MFDWIRNIILRKWVKGALDKLPFNYRKTVIGLSILALSAVMMVCATFYPEQCGPNTTLGELILSIYSWIKDLDAEAIATIGGVVAAGGALHKYSKFIDKNESIKEEHKS